MAKVTITRTEIEHLQKGLGPKPTREEVEEFKKRMRIAVEYEVTSEGHHGIHTIFSIPRKATNGMGNQDVYLISKLPIEFDRDEREEIIPGTEQRYERVNCTYALDMGSAELKTYCLSLMEADRIAKVNGIEIDDQTGRKGSELEALARSLALRMEDTINDDSSAMWDEQPGA